MLRIIETLYSYDAWATDRTLDSMEELTVAEYRYNVAGSRGSICETFAHLVAVEWRFFSWLDGSVPADVAFALEVDGDEIASVSAARRRWRTLKEQAAWFIGSLSDQALTRVHAGALPDGLHFRLPLWKILLHVSLQNMQARAEILAAIHRIHGRAASADLLGHALCIRKNDGIVYQ